jgi:hypothetical protein
MGEMSEETTEASPAPRIIALVATIPARKISCTRVLAELSKQMVRKPDGVVLVLDGYGEEPAPACPLPIIATHRTDAPLGAGNRWRVVAAGLLPEDIIICVDDDVMLVQAPRFVDMVAKAVIDGGGAAAAMGTGPDGRRAPPGNFSRGALLHGMGCGLAMRAKHLDGLQAFADEVKAAGGPDALGLLGDDDALISAFLWKTGVKILHAKTGNLYSAPQTRTTSAASARTAKGEDFHTQKTAIKKVTGWPWLSTPIVNSVPPGKVPVVRRA